MANHTAISISVDQIWAGSGKLRDGIIEDCGAQFCDDNDASLAIYEDIEEAIAAGLDHVDAEIDGETKRITWIITDPLSEVRQYIADHEDDDEHDEYELARLFRIAYGRDPDAEDRAEGLWSHLVAAM